MAKQGRFIGNLVSLLTTLKGLSDDRQSATCKKTRKQFLILSIRSNWFFEVYAAMIPEIEVDSERTRLWAANDPGLLATDLADYLGSLPRPPVSG